MSDQARVEDRSSESRLAQGPTGAALEFLAELPEDEKYEPPRAAPGLRDTTRTRTGE